MATPEKKAGYGCGAAAEGFWTAATATQDGARGSVSAASRVTCLACLEAGHWVPGCGCGCGLSSGFGFGFVSAAAGPADFVNAAPRSGAPVAARAQGSCPGAAGSGLCRLVGSRGDLDAGSEI